jgi:periplasmic protein TonB
MTLWSNEWPAPGPDDPSAAGAPVERRPVSARSAGTTLWSNEWRPPTSDDVSTGYAPPTPRGARAAAVRRTSSTGSDAAIRLFSDHYPVTGPNAVQAFWERMGFSIVAHAIAAAVVVAFVVLAPKGFMTSKPMESIPFHDIIFLNQPGPGGGGGGGGNRMKLPEKKAELAGQVKKPAPQVVPEAKPADTPPPPPLDIPAKTSFDATQTVAGSIDGLANSLSQGPGSGGGSGTGTGTGIGPGTGSGLGPGWGGGFGGGAYRPGSGIENPLVLREVRPEYTADAMRAKIQGMVQLECVVLPDGSVGEVRVTRSLDPVFGLDQKAIVAAKQWRFVPGKLRQTGQPVSVLVLIELTFTLR